MTDITMTEITLDGDPADRFRRKIGRFAERWYVDPFPTCSIAPASDSEHPAVTTVGKASGKDWSFVALGRVADALAADPEHLEGCDAVQIRARLKAIDKAGLKAAAARGTSVHRGMENLLHGRPLGIADDDPGADYRAAITAFFDHHQPTMLHAEVVGISRTLHGYGYGGTVDAFVEIGGERYVIDWKSRAPSSKHGAYPSEAAQIGAYADFDYLMDHDGRIAMPELDGGLIVSIRPDGFRLYPVDLEVAAEHFAALHSWWVARRSERDAIGRPRPEHTIAAPSSSCTADVEQPPGDAPSPSPGDRRTALLERYNLLDPADQARVEWPDDRTDLDAVEAAIDAVDPFAQSVAPVSRQAPERPPERPVLAANPDEGTEVPEADYTVLEDRYAALDDHARAWMNTIAGQARAAGVPVSMENGTKRTLRRWEALCALVTLADGWVDDDTLRALLALVVGDDVARHPALTPGAILGSLDAPQMATLARLAVQLDDGGMAMAYDTDGRLVLSEAAA